MPTLNLQVGASSDDARENSGTMGLVASTINIGGGQQLGFRFTNVTVPQAATIDSAILSLYLTSTDNDTPNGLTVGMEDVDDAATFASTTNNISDRTRTSTVNWNGTNIGSGWKAIDVTTPVQAVVNRAGWISGNAMAALLHGITGANVTIQTYDGNTSLAAKLDITYTTSSAGVATKATYYARMRA